MSPLPNANSNSTSNSNNLNSLSTSPSINQTSSSNSSGGGGGNSSAFKPLISESRSQLNMLSSTVTSASSAAIDPYSTDLTSAYGSAYHHHHHHHLNSQLTQDYLNVHQSLPLVYKSEHDDLQSGYSFARPVKLYEHSSATSPSTGCVSSGGGGGTSASNGTSGTGNGMQLTNGILINSNDSEQMCSNFRDFCFPFFRVGEYKWQ